jgi:hypothetical protein
MTHPLATIGTPHDAPFGCCPCAQVLSFLGLIVSIAFTIHNMRIGTGFGSFFYLGSMGYGYLAWRAGSRKVGARRGRGAGL